MIQEFVDLFMENKHKLEIWLKSNHPSNYKDLVEQTLSLLGFSSEQITEISTGGYSGTLLFIIAGDEYSSDFWFVKIYYGSCSGCDTLEEIRNYDGNPPTEEQIKDYMMLALHIVQELKKLKES